VAGEAPPALHSAVRLLTLSSDAAVGAARIRVRYATVRHVVGTVCDSAPMSDLSQEQAGGGTDNGKDARLAEVAEMVAQGQLPVWLDARERARLMAESAREELELDAAQPGGSHAARAAAFASLAVSERMEAAELVAELGPDAYEKLYRDLAKTVRGTQRIERIEAAAARFEDWAQRNIGDRVDRWGERSEAALQKRGR
jgi:hypothetical protein